MAQKRMFDRAIIDTDRFMDLSISAKAMYFLLGMEADDEGFVSYKKVMRIHGGNEDDVKILILKNFLIGFESGVVVITDWNKNNWLDVRRTRNTEYKKEKALLTLTASKEYVLSTGLASIEESSIEESSIEYTAEDKSSGKDINELITLFEKINPTFAKLYKMKNQRNSCKSLLKLRPIKEWSSVLDFIAKQTGDKYCPRIATPSQLEDKYANLVAYAASLKTTSNKNQIYGL